MPTTWTNSATWTAQVKQFRKDTVTISGAGPVVLDAMNAIARYHGWTFAAPDPVDEDLSIGLIQVGRTGGHCRSHDRYIDGQEVVGTYSIKREV